MKSICTKVSLGEHIFTLTKLANNKSNTWGIHKCHFSGHLLISLKPQEWHLIFARQFSLITAFLKICFLPDSPKKSQKDTSQKSPQKAAPSTSNKDTPKKEVPEKAILKRDPSAANNKTPSSPVTTAIYTASSAAATNPSVQVPGARPATLTPTTKPLITPATSTSTTVSAGMGNNASAAAMAAAIAAENAKNPKQRTNSIGDTWEFHKVCYQWVH